MKGVFGVVKIRKTIPAKRLHNVVALPKSFDGKNVTITIEEQKQPEKKDVSSFDRAYAFLMSHTIKSDITIEETRDIRLFIR